MVAQSYLKLQNSILSEIWLFNFWLKPACVGCSHNNKSFWQFCGDQGSEPIEENDPNSNDSYDKSSPTKQNIQCSGESAVSVIASSCQDRRRGKSDTFHHAGGDEGKSVETRNFVTLPPSLTEQRNFVTISTDKNKLRLNPKFGAATGKDGIRENFSQILLEVSWKKWPRKYKI